MWVRQDQRFSWISSACEPNFASVQSIWCHPRIPTRIIIVFDELKHIPNSVLFPVQVPKKSFFKLSFPQQQSFRSRGTTGSPMSAYGLRYLCRGRCGSCRARVSATLHVFAPEWFLMAPLDWESLEMFMMYWEFWELIILNRLYRLCVLMSQNKEEWLRKMMCSW